MSKNEYKSISDDCGVIGYGFYCSSCGEFNMFVDEEDEAQHCESCGHENIFEPISYKPE